VDIRATLVDILENLGIEAEDITEEARIRADLELDSTDTIEIMLELKRKLGVEVKLESKQDKTVAELVGMVEQAAVAPAAG
jgi:acyl carrier protein